MQIEIIRSKQRKTLGLEVKTKGVLIVRAPERMPESVIFKFVNEKQDWIEKAFRAVESRAEKHPEPTDDEIKALKQKAGEYLPKAVEYYGNLMGLKPSSLKITSARGRFGSCSGKNGLCFSYRLMMYPKEAIDYVVVHELAHIKHHDHSPRFWGLVAEYMPDYKARRQLLRE